MSLFNMLPASSFNNTIHGLMRNSPFPRKFSMPNISRVIFGPHASHLLFGENGFMMTFPRWGNNSPLHGLISIVISSCPKPKMRRIAAGRVVASMQNTDSIRDGAVFHHPSMPVSEHMFIINFCSAIPKIIFSKFKFPAICGRFFVNIKPKVLANGGDIIRQSSSSTKGVGFAIFVFCWGCTIFGDAYHLMTVDYISNHVKGALWLTE